MLRIGIPVCNACLAVKHAKGVISSGEQPKLNPSDLAGSRSSELGMDGGDDGMKDLNAEAEEMAGYWRERPAEWAALSLPVAMRVNRGDVRLEQRGLVGSSSCTPDGTIAIIHASRVLTLSGAQQ
jgi:hypothetical protein